MGMPFFPVSRLSGWPKIVVVANSKNIKINCFFMLHKFFSYSTRVPFPAEIFKPSADAEYEPIFELFTS